MTRACQFVFAFLGAVRLVLGLTSPAAAASAETHVGGLDATVVSCTTLVALSQPTNHRAKYDEPAAKTVDSCVAPEGGGKGTHGTKLKPDSAADGAHTTFKRDPNRGKVTNQAEWDANGNPVKRTDVTGRAHGPVQTPHTHEYGSPNVNPATGKSYPGKEVNVRPATPSEIPKR